MEKAKILIVDDEVEICLNISDTFGHENYSADYATTAKDAFEKIGQCEYGLVLVDIKLEGRYSGIDIIKACLEKEKQPKIIVVSAIPWNALDPVFEKEGIAQSVHGYIDKPSCSDPEKLMGVVKRTLG
jgi:DNA-binding response OmpR family regulator